MKTTGYKFIYASYINNLEIFKYMKNENAPICIYDVTVECDGTVWNQYFYTHDVKPGYEIEPSTYYTFVVTITGLSDPTLADQIVLYSNTESGSGSLGNISVRLSSGSTYALLKTEPTILYAVCSTVHNPELNLGAHTINLKIYEGDVIEYLREKEV